MSSDPMCRLKPKMTLSSEDAPDKLFEDMLRLLKDSIACHAAGNAPAHKPMNSK